MIITLTGANTFLLKRELKRLVDAFVSEYGDMALERLDGEELAYDRLRESLQSMPFLASKKLVVLRSPGANKEFAEKAAALLGDLPETTDVIIVEPKLDKRLSYYKFLKANSTYHEYPEADAPALIQWLVGEANAQQASITREDARYLIDRVGTNQQLVANELDKLIAYSSQITRQSIDLLTEPTSVSSIFDLLDAALAGRATQALALYQEQRNQKVEPQQILAMLAWQLHTLAIVKVAGSRDPGMIAKEAKLNPYVVRKTQTVASHLTLKQVALLLDRTLALDIRLKSQAVDADEALMHLLTSLT